MPPFPALEAFLAVARTGSVRAAARALNVTDSAVSHQLRKLEDHLGSPVLERHGRGVQLTAAGRRYAKVLDAPLSEIAEATDRLFGSQGEVTITLTTAPVVASLALIPQIPQLEAAHPELILRLVTTVRQLDLDSHGIDLAVRYEVASSETAGPLMFPEYAFPVCAPALVQSDPAEILRQRRLLNSAHPEDWRIWKESAGYSCIPDGPSMSFDTSEMSLGAAVQGMGVAIGRTPLVNDYLVSGRLVAPFGRSARGEGRYKIVQSPGRRKSKAREVVINWLGDVLGRPQATRVAESET